MKKRKTYNKNFMIIDKDKHSKPKIKVIKKNKDGTKK